MAIYRTKNNITDIPAGVKVPMKFDLSVLNMFIGYIFKENSSNITRKSLSIMNKLFKVIDEAAYVGEPQLEVRFEFINNALDAKLDRGFENRDMIINYCRSDISNKDNDEIIANIDRYTKINYEEIRFINQMVEDRLKHYYMKLYAMRFYDCIDKFESGDFRSFREMNDELAKLCTEFLTQSRRAKTFDSHDEFSFDDDNFENSVMDIVSNLKNPNKMLRTGIQKLNEMLSPALLGGRTYIFMGTPGGFKSGFLLKIARDIKKYNKGITCKPGKRPTVMLLTMENSVEETVERLFNMTTSAEDIRSFTPSQVVKMIKQSGEFSVTDDNDINIVIKYHANRTISTDDIYTMIDDMSDAGKEVIALVFDYIKRIRPAEYAKDEKGELKNITNELKSLAQHYNIPVITAHQLNRDAANTVDSALQANKADLAKSLGRGQVGTALISGASYWRQYVRHSLIVWDILYSISNCIRQSAARLFYNSNVQRLSICRGENPL